MYKPGEMYSAVKSRIDSATNFVVDHKSALARTMAAGLVAVVAGCATPQKPLAPLASNTPNSVVLANGERVCDVSGLWDADYGISNDVVDFKRDGKSFVGVKTIGGVYVGKGSQTIRGKLKMDNFESLEVFHSNNGWTSSSGEFSNGCNAIDVQGSDVYVRLKRKK